jgi:hypothetical protein
VKSSIQIFFSFRVFTGRLPPPKRRTVNGER